MQRRAFVGGVFAGLGITGLSARRPRPRSGDIPKRAFGKTGEQLTIIGQGGGRLRLLPNKEAAVAVVRRSYELGINYFDCARYYWDGKAEEVYGEVLPPWRKQIFLTT